MNNLGFVFVAGALWSSVTHASQISVVSDPFRHTTHYSGSFGSEGLYFNAGAIATSPLQRATVTFANSDEAGTDMNLIFFIEFNILAGADGWITDCCESWDSVNKSSVGYKSTLVQIFTKIPNGYEFEFRLPAHIKESFGGGSYTTYYWYPIPMFIEGHSDSTAITNFNISIATVPEPSSWAFMVIGFGILGAAFRRRGIVQQFE